MRLTHLNFVVAASSARGWRLVVLAIGILALSAVGLYWLLEKQTVTALENKLAQTQPRIVVKPVRSAIQQRQLDMQVKAVMVAVQQLNLPISDMIRSLQPPKDIRVGLLGLEVGSKGAGVDPNVSGVLKIAAETKTPQEMMTYVAFLGDQSLFKSVYLIKHELNAASPERPYRFQLEAQWRD